VLPSPIPDVKSIYHPIEPSNLLSIGRPYPSTPYSDKDDPECLLIPQCVTDAPVLKALTRASKKEEHDFASPSLLVPVTNSNALDSNGELF